MSKKISVIVPVYNVSEYLPKCLDSLINQTHQNLEIILINDGSTDNSKDVIDKYVNLYPTKIKAFHNQNQGIAATRNFGLNQVTGDYFGFLDSDDYAEPTMYADMLDIALKEGSDLVVTDFFWTEVDKETIYHEGPYQPKQDMVVNLFATLWNKLYKTEIIKKTGLTFPDGYRYEDASFLYRLAPYLNNISFINKPYVHYVQREASITHTHNSRVKDMVYVFEDILDYYKKHDLYDTYKNELEYIFVRFFLGNSFLRSVKIQDKNDRKLTLKLSWDLLNNHFPKWHKNPILKQKKDLKHMYFRTMNSFSYNVYAFIFSKVSR